MSKELTVYQAFDRAEIKTLPMIGKEAVDPLFQNAQIALKNPLKPYKRIEILEKVIEIAKGRVPELAITVAREGGKPLVDATVEIERGIQGIQCAIETLKTECGTEVPMGLTPSSEGRLAFTTHEPIGIVVAVSAFNHPFNLIVHQVIPAVAVGCPVIVKPAQLTPISCYNLVEMLYEAGLPKEWCQIALIDREGAELLVTDSRVNFFSFIGSAKVGWYLKSKLAPGARCSLEHGGVAPVIVDSNVDIDSIIAPLAKGAFYHSGQVCVSVQRIFVHKNILEDFSQKISAAASVLKVGDPTLKETAAGPLILPREADRVEQWVYEAKEAGGKILIGGERVSNTCYQPTVILNPSKESKVSTSEIFGPVVCLYGYDKLDEAIATSNSLPVAFQASIFSKDIDIALKAAKSLDASAVMINDHTAFRVDWMPFAGRRSSGLGTGGIPHTMRDMTQEKMIVFKSSGLS